MRQKCIFGHIWHIWVRIWVPGKNTIRDGGNIALYTPYTVDTVYTGDTVHTVYTVCTIQTADALLSKKWSGLDTKRNIVMGLTG